MRSVMHHRNTYVLLGDSRVDTVTFFMNFDSAFNFFVPLMCAIMDFKNTKSM